MGHGGASGYQYDHEVEVELEHEHEHGYDTGAGTPMGETYLESPLRGYGGSASKQHTPGRSAEGMPVSYMTAPAYGAMGPGGGRPTMWRARSGLQQTGPAAGSGAGEGAAPPSGDTAADPFLISSN